MTIRARLAAAALCALACACDRGAPAPAPPDAPAAPPPGAPPAGERAVAPPRRGDRHARAAARRARPLREVVGTIVRAEGGRVAIRPREGREVTLRIGPRTALTAPGRGAGRATLAPGDEVRASYRSGEGDPPTALSVELREAPRGEASWTDRG